jgi:hypothetical protein
MGNKEKSLDDLVSILLVALIIILFVIIGLYVFEFNGGISNSQTTWGEFGDFFGGIAGSLISLFAVILLFVTYRLQKEELAKTSKALDNQNDQLIIHHFRDTVFKLLDRKDDVIDKFHYDRQSKLEGIAKLTGELRTVLKRKEEFSKTAHNHWWGRNRKYMITYFTTVVSALEFMRTYKLDDTIKDRIIGLYFATFDRREIELLEYAFKGHSESSLYEEDRKFFEKYKGIFI